MRCGGKGDAIPLIAFQNAPCGSTGLFTLIFDRGLFSVDSLVELEEIGIDYIAEIPFRRHIEIWEGVHSDSYPLKRRLIICMSRSYPWRSWLHSLLNP